MVDCDTFAEKAYSYRDSHIPYKTLDCQAFVEKVLSDCGCKKNWRGSNHMWRDALTWKGTIDEAITLYGDIPRGAWLFTVKNDGGEVKRGYKDSEGNAAHVGIYTGAGKGAMHSTTGGVQECAYPATRWTHCGLCKYIDYHLTGKSLEVNMEGNKIKVVYLDSDGDEQTEILELVEAPETYNIKSVEVYADRSVS